MASDLIGISVVVTLKFPPNTTVHGRVANVNPQTSTLTLQDVFFPATGHRLTSYQVEGAQIADINVEPPAPPPAQHPPPQAQLPPQAHRPPQAHPPPQAYPPTQAPPPQQQYYQDPAIVQAHQYNPRQVHQPVPAHHTPPAVPTPKKQSFVDPAILSVGKRPETASPVKSSGGSHLAAPAVPEAPATPVELPKPASTLKNGPSLLQQVQKPAQKAPARSKKQSAAILTEPFSALDIANDAGALEEDTDEPTVVPDAVRRMSFDKTRTGKPMDSPIKPGENARKTRRGGKSKKKELVEEPDSPEVIKRTPNGTVRGKGWRQTPLLENQPRSPRVSGLAKGTVKADVVPSSSRKQRRKKLLEEQSGWATEDATDIQDLPDFDFVGNLNKFDKRSVFEQIRNEDTTADEDRLVSHNRIARPGTYGGKNLHPTENVLDGPSRSSIRADSFSSTEDEYSDFGSGRTSRRNMSRASAKRVPLRQGSTVTEDILMHSATGPSLLTRATRTVNRTVHSTSQTSGSPKPGLGASPGSPLVDGTSRGGVRSRLRYVKSDRTCHTVTPGTMLAIEEVAEFEYGITEDVMAEAAGRGIADVALLALNPGGRRLAQENVRLNARPVVVVLAGNTRTGARALAAARLLRSRGVKVMAFLLGYEREVDWDRDVQRQVSRFARLGGFVRGWPEIEAQLKRLDAPPELIVDALLDRHKEFDALGDVDQHTVLKVVGWANKSRAHVLAVEGPSGVRKSDGDVKHHEGEPIEVRAKYVVCLAAPRTGVLRALQRRNHHHHHHHAARPPWLLWVVDLGVNAPALWRRAGVAHARPVRFGGEWVVRVCFEEGGEARGEGEGDGEGVGGEGEGLMMEEVGGKGVGGVGEGEVEETEETETEVETELEGVRGRREA